MASFYINYRNNRLLEEQIIDEKTLQDAEKGLNYLNPDDFIYLCDANSLEEAEDKYLSDCLIDSWDR